MCALQSFKRGEHLPQDPMAGNVMLLNGESVETFVAQDDKAAVVLICLQLIIDVISNCN